MVERGDFLLAGFELLHPAEEARADEFVVRVRAQPLEYLELRRVKRLAADAVYAAFAVLPRAELGVDGLDDRSRQLDAQPRVGSDVLRKDRAPLLVCERAARHRAELVGVLPELKPRHLRRQLGAQEARVQREEDGVLEDLIEGDVEEAVARSDEAEAGGCREHAVLARHARREVLVEADWHHRLRLEVRLERVGLDDVQLGSVGVGDE